MGKPKELVIKMIHLKEDRHDTPWSLPKPKLQVCSEKAKIQWADDRV
jgi:hypothetical protein